MIIEGLGSSLIVGKIRGGKFSNMKDAEIHKWYLIVTAFIIEFAAVILSSKGYQAVSNNIFTIHFISYIFLFIGIYFNISKHSFKLIMLGTFLNFLVIMLNGGQMPVSAEAFIKAGIPEQINDQVITHSLITADTKLKFLGDVLFLPKPYPRPKVLSLGDVFMAVGVFIYIQELMVRKSDIKKHNKAYDNM